MSRSGEPHALALINAESAGELLGVTASWVLEQARRDRIPHVRLGRYVRFDPTELEAWWRGRLRGPLGPPGPHPIPRGSKCP
jgi:excisionase family DNA binding protein